MVALNVRCYVAVAVQADRLVNSRLQGSEPALFYFSSLPPGVRRWGQEWVRQNGQAALVRAGVAESAWEHPGSSHSEHIVRAARGPGPLLRPRGSLSLARLFGRVTLGLLGRPSAGWLMELLPEAPGAGPRRRWGCFLPPGPLGAQGQIETGSLQGRC